MSPQSITVVLRDRGEQYPFHDKGNFDLEDLRSQLQQMKKMGGMGALMGLMPGMGQVKKAMAGANIDEKVFDRQVAVINSMTKAERANPDLLNAKRRIRIANRPVRQRRSGPCSRSGSVRGQA